MAYDISKNIGKPVTVYVKNNIEAKGILLQENGFYVVAYRASEADRTRPAHLVIDENSIDKITDYEFSNMFSIGLSSCPEKRYYGSRAGRKINKKLIKSGL